MNKMSEIKNCYFCNISTPSLNDISTTANALNLKIQQTAQAIFTVIKKTFDSIYTYVHSFSFVYTSPVTRTASLVTELPASRPATPTSTSSNSGSNFPKISLSEQDAIDELFQLQESKFSGWLNSAERKDNSDAIKNANPLAVMQYVGKNSEYMNILNKKPCKHFIDGLSAAIVKEKSKSSTEQMANAIIQGLSADEAKKPKITGLLNDLTNSNVKELVKLFTAKQQNVV